MSNEYGKTISTKIGHELTEKFEAVLKRNGHTKQVVLRSAVLAYIDKFSEDTYYKEFTDSINFPNPEKE